MFSLTFIEKLINSVFFDSMKNAEVQATKKILFLHRTNGSIAILESSNPQLSNDTLKIYVP